MRRFQQITKGVLGRRKIKNPNTWRETLVGQRPRPRVQPKHRQGRNGKEDSKGRTAELGGGRRKGRKEMDSKEKFIHWSPVI